MRHIVVTLAALLLAPPATAWWRRAWCRPVAFGGALYVTVNDGSIVCLAGRK